MQNARFTPLTPRERGAGAFDMGQPSFYPTLTYPAVYAALVRLRAGTSDGISGRCAVYNHQQPLTDAATAVWNMALILLLMKKENPVCTKGRNKLVHKESGNEK